MKNIIITFSTTILLFLVTSCNSEQKEIKTPKEIKTQNKSLYETCPIKIDTTFSFENKKFNLKIRIREDLLSRQIANTYQCEKKGLITHYGNEFILELYEVNDTSSTQIALNFINLEAINKLDIHYKMNDMEFPILGSEISYGGIKNNMCVLSVSSNYSEGEGSYMINLGYDMMYALGDYCHMGGIILLDIIDPYEDYTD
jgi:hypothetical protein